jgi:hypothetical protein
MPGADPGPRVEARAVPRHPRSPPMSAPPIVLLKPPDRSGDPLGWWRNGVICEVHVRSFQDHDKISDCLPPDTAGWFLEASP